MTLTTHIRFLEPIDPRKVWKMACELVNAPKPFEVRKQRRGDPIFGSLTYDNDGMRAVPDQGADALLWMEYGHEGSPLNDTYYDDPDEDYRPPAAYVELFLDTPYGAAVDHRPWIKVISEWSPVPVRWWQGECCEKWHQPDETIAYAWEGAAR
jgi:hypothetical protein